MITNHYELEEWETAFANLRAKQDVKALIHPNSRGWIRVEGRSVAMKKLKFSYFQLTFGQEESVSLP